MLHFAAAYYENLDQEVQSKMNQVIDSTGQKVWNCIVCSYARKRISDVRKHIERKHIDMQFQCEYCDSVVSSRENLKNHLKIRHNIVQA